jgi:glycyl-tRNA synthetase alpha chain
MYMQEVENVYDLKWNDRLSYGQVHKKGEWELSTYNFEVADVDMLLSLFNLYEKEATRAGEMGFVLPAFDCCLKCSHTFNLLDARGAVSVTERTHYIDRIRRIVRLAARNYVDQREEMGFPLLEQQSDGD